MTLKELIATLQKIERETGLGDTPVLFDGQDNADFSFDDTYMRQNLPGGWEPVVVLNIEPIYE